MTAKLSDISDLPYWPRWLSAEQAAAYVSESKTVFLEKVAARKWPAPRREGKRLSWDRKLLDLRSDKLSGLDIELAPELDEFEEAARGYHQNAQN